MSYFFYAERFHFINFFNIPSFLAGMIFLLVLGFIFRYFVPTKKIFYRALVGMFVVWVISEITYATVFALDKLELLEIAGVCFQLAWVLFCFFVGSLFFHILCSLFHKRILK